MGFLLTCMRVFQWEFPGHRAQPRFIIPLESPLVMLESLLLWRLMLLGSLLFLKVSDFLLSGCNGYFGNFPRVTLRLQQHADASHCHLLLKGVIAELFWICLWFTAKPGTFQSVAVFTWKREEVMCTDFRSAAPSRAIVCSSYNLKK